MATDLNTIRPTASPVWASFYFSLKRANEADSSGVSGSALARGSAHAAAAEQSAGGPG